jgi:hypothetical protein
MSDWARYAALHLRGAQGQADLSCRPGSGALSGASRGC